MAVRYSGDVEMRASSKGSWLRISFRWPEHGRVRSHVVFLPEKGGRTLKPSQYDRLVRNELSELLSSKPWLPIERGLFGRPVLRRVFQAPCPR